MKYLVFFLFVLLMAGQAAAESAFSEAEIKLMDVGSRSCDIQKLHPEMQALYELADAKISKTGGFTKEAIEWLWVVAEEFQQQAVYSKSQIADLEKCRFSNADWHLEQARVHFQSSVFNRLVATN